ncbi:MAG: hypothetical protein WCV90_02860 [Candidatus Woesearchaeota archaeon]
MVKNLVKKLWQKWLIAFKILPILLMVILLKILSHYLGYEVIALNSLFTSLVGGTIFLLGFLISGVLSDYKESEKIPSEFAASLESLYDQSYTLYKSKKSKTAKEFIKYQQEFMTSLNDWFYKKERTRSLLEKISKMNDFFIEFEKEGIQANYIIRMENEQSTIRKMVLRIHTIRDTDFIQSAYAIVEALGFALALGMVITKIEPFYESMFFTILVTFLISYMFFLIKDLDNPFEYSSHGESGTEVSLKPIHDLEQKIKNLEIK